MPHVKPRWKSPISRTIAWLLGHFHYGAAHDLAWRPHHQVGAKGSSTAFLVLGGLSANGVAANRQLSRSLHRTCTSVHTWSRNLSGHTGRLLDFSGSRFWHWITDGVKTLRELTFRQKVDDVILVGHSTGGLVVLALAIMFELFPKWLSPNGKETRIRGVLIFPPFQLKRRIDAVLLSIVAVLYYLICPVAFLMLAFTGPWMWPMALLAFLLHILLVPQISVPNGEERARQAARGQRWVELPDQLVLAAACIYFVVAPPVIALIAGAYPGSWSSGVFAVFIASLLTPLLLMPREVAQGSQKQVARQAKYPWLPIITAANLVIFQALLRPLLRLVRCPILVLEAELDQVVSVDPRWARAMSSADVQQQCLPGFPHSNLSVDQQVTLSEIIVQWCQRSPAGRL